MYKLTEVSSECKVAGPFEVRVQCGRPETAHIELSGVARQLCEDTALRELKHQLLKRGSANAVKIEDGSLLPDGKWQASGTLYRCEGAVGELVRG